MTFAIADQLQPQSDTSVAYLGTIDTTFVRFYCFTGSLKITLEYV